MTLTQDTADLLSLTVNTGASISSNDDGDDIRLAGNLTLNGSINIAGDIRLEANSIWGGTATGAALRTDRIDLRGRSLTFTDNTVAYTIELTGSTPLLNHGSLNNNGANRSVTFAMVGGNQSWEVYSVKYPNLLIGGSGTKTYQASAIEVLGDLTINSGATFTATAATSTNYIGGNLTRNGTFNVPGGSGTWVFNGTTAQTITGGVTFYRMRVSNTNGVTLNSGNLSIGSGSSGGLELNSGNVVTGSNKVVISTPCNSNLVSGSGWVNGFLQLTFPGFSATCTFRVGDNTTAAPVVLNLPYSAGIGGVSGTTLTASTTGTEHPQIASSGLNASKSVNRYWTLGQPDDTFGCIPPGDVYNPGRYVATFQFAAADRDPGTNTSAFKVGRYFGGWAAPSASNTTATSTSIEVSIADGTPSFGTFAIGEQSGAPSGSGPDSRCSNAVPLADWHMDEFAWNGTTSEVQDSSGNGHHGRAAAVSGATASTATGSPAYTNGALSTCRYGQFDSGSASRTYVELASFPSLTTRFTYAGWIRSTNVGASGQRILVNDDAQNGWALSLGDGGTGRVRVYNRSVNNSGAVSGDGNNPACGVFCIDTDNVVSNNSWRYVALTVNTASQDVELYVFDAAGSRLARAAGKYAGTWAYGSGAVAIGGETAASSEGQSASFHFRGNIDELQVFGTTLSQSQLATELQRTRPCSALDHIELVHDGAALTCTAEAVTVLACSGSASCLGAPANQVAGSFTITPTTVSGTQWCADALCATPLAGSVAVSSGSMLYLRKPAAGTVRMAGVVSSPATNATLQCRNTATSGFNATTACDVDYATAGLLMNAVSHASCTPQTITLQAVKSNDTNTRCVPAFSGINHDLSMSLSYLNPASGTRNASFDYVTSSGGATSSIAAMGTSNVTLSNLYWDANATATLTNFRYPDVGRVRLNPTLTGSGSTSGLSMSAIGGNEFIAAPASFSFSSITAGPIIASTNFSATVTAMNACTTPAATPNFGLEAAPESVILSLGTRVAPSGANNCSTGPCNGAVSGNVTLPWSNGAATASNLRYSEVGEITLAAALASSNYLLSGLTATGTSATISAFIPAYFETAVTPACGTAFTYSAQPFSVTVTAYNNVGGITRNYSGFSPTCSVCSKDVTLSNAGNVTGFSGTNTLTAASFVGGVGTKATVAYTFPNRLTAPATITLRGVDSTNSSITSLNHDEGSTLIRSGRARLLNASGSELLDLPVPFTVEYWNGADGWQRSSNDACTGTAGNAVSLALSGGPAAQTCVRDNGSPGESGAGCAATLVGRQYQDASNGAAAFQGNFNLWLRAPGAGNPGTVTVTSTVPGWLMYPWLSATPTSPVGRATFGVIRSGPVIYRREAY